MAILSDKDIKERLNKDLIIQPINLSEQLSPASIDLRLGNRFRIFKLSDHALIDIKEYKDNKLREYTTNNGKVIDYEYTTLYESDKPFIIHPGEFVLASIKEYIEIPYDLIGRIDGRSSLGRLGLIVHATAGYIDPGFKGHITLELSNIGMLPIKLYPSMRIARLVFEEMKSIPDITYDKRPSSKYSGEDGATPSRLDLETKEL